MGISILAWLSSLDSVSGQYGGLGLPLIAALLKNIYSAINCVEWNSVSKI
jgi:hypothetical protein